MFLIRLQNDDNNRQILLRYGSRIGVGGRYSFTTGFDNKFAKK